MNYTVADGLGVLKACFALAPFLFAPGYAIGWALDLFDFRQRRPMLRFVLAVPLSIAICPTVSYLSGRFMPPALWVFYGGAGAVCLWLLAKELRTARFSSFSRPVWIAIGVALLWAVIVTASLSDLQLGDSLYTPVSAYDHATRVEITAAIARHIPPHNPFFADSAVPLRYHYLWFLLCSLPLKILHFSPRHLIYGGVVWCGIGLMCTVALGLKFLLREQAAIERKSLLAVVLLCVTGLDILPTLYAASLGRWLADMEWWNQAQITSWAASLLWVPHHVAALIACFVGFMLLRHYADACEKPVAAVAIAGLAFAGAAGLSIYLTFTFLVAIGLWMLAVLVQRNRKEIGMFLAAGVVAGVCALPYLLSLCGPGSGTSFVEFALRPFPLGIVLAEKIGISIRTQTAASVSDAILLPLNYALELGFFLAIGSLRFARIRRKEIAFNTNESACWTLIGTSFLVGSFLQSSTITTNDLGIRCFLPAQLVLLLWAADFIHEWWLAKGPAQTRPSRPILAALALLLISGVTGTVYEVFMIRMAPVLYDKWQIAGLNWMDPDGQGGRRTYALRSLYESLNAQLPSSAVVQHNPVAPTFLPHALYSEHDAAAGGLDCGVGYGGDENACRERVRALAALFEGIEDPGNACRAYGIDVVVVKDTDPVWRDHSSWVWSNRPLTANGYARAFHCGAALASFRR